MNLTFILELKVAFLDFVAAGDVVFHNYTLLFLLCRYDLLIDEYAAFVDIFRFMPQFYFSALFDHMVHN